MVNYIPKKNKTLGEYEIKSPVSTGELKNMKATVEKTVTIDDGKHTGVIDAIEYKDKPYSYVDVCIREEKEDVVIKLGLPFSVTENTMLGRVLKEFGATLEVGKEVEIEDFIKKGQNVEFVTVTEDTKSGKFARIQPLSLKLKK